MPKAQRAALLAASAGAGPLPPILGLHPAAITPSGSGAEAEIAAPRPRRPRGKRGRGKGAAAPAAAEAAEPTGDEHEPTGDMANRPYWFSFLAIFSGARTQQECGLFPKLGVTVA